jgi:hypothetical protein
VKKLADFYYIMKQSELSVFMNGTARYQQWKKRNEKYLRYSRYLLMEFTHSVHIKCSQEVSVHSNIGSPKTLASDLATDLPNYLVPLLCQVSPIRAIPFCSFIRVFLLLSSMHP